MKNTFKHISLLAFGIAAVALLTSGRPTPAPAVSASHTPTLKIVSLPFAVQVADGQETHGDGDKGKKGG